MKIDDHVYDIYEGDVIVINHVDFVFKNCVFKKVCAKFTQDVLTSASHASLTTSQNSDTTLIKCLFELLG